MQQLMSQLLLSVVLVTPVAGQPATDEEAFARALDAARSDPGIPFSLDVSCADGAERRSIEVIRGRLAVWNGAVQVRLDEEERDGLVGLLSDADFANFEARYGEATRADKQEAPLRVSCRVHVEVNGLEKTSVQLLDGKQSERLSGLAGALIDVVEPKAGDGETAHSIEDGLAKIATGRLEPEVLNMRWLALPDAGTRKPGLIARVTRGQIEYQPYVPGEDIGETASSELTASQLEALIRAFEQAEFWGLPINLRSNGLNEIELTILGEAKTVVARSSFTAGPAEQQAAFDTLLLNLADIIGQ
jgi:hypothetical protein